MDVPPPPPDPADSVTASALVRRFGQWRERASTRPVYIFHRGRPVLVLAPVARVGLSADDKRAAALLEGSPEVIIVVDPDGNVLVLGRAARALFGEGGGHSAPIAALAPAAAQPAFAAAIRRVAATGMAETIEIGLSRPVDRRMAFAIEPHPDGAVLFGRAVLPSLDDGDSFDATFAESRDGAVARLDAHGFLDGPHTSLAALTGIAPSILVSLRFVSLFVADARAGIAGAIEAATESGEPCSAAGRLLIEAGEPRPVRVAFATRPYAAGVVALILATS